tara:strand:+ start:4915 stop:5877 length:963 start_codon:yes stop_codon:yes gene_type:complete
MLISVTLHLPTLYLLIFGSASLTLVGWFVQLSDMWYSGLAASAFVYNLIHCYEWASSDQIRRGQNAMQIVRTCCCEQYVSCRGLWASPSGAFALLVALRGLGGLVATAAFMVPVFGDKVIQIMWRVAVSLWLASCVPGLVCLVQCAAYAKREQLKFLKSFRTQLALRLMHDVMLGIFWLYLALRVDDVLGGGSAEDEREWHTIFMSMLSWHLVVVLVHDIYFSKTTRFISGGCCDKANAHLWIKSLRILGIVGLYAVVIHRVNDNTRPLSDMGCTGVEFTVVILATALLCFVHAQNIRLRKDSGTCSVVEPQVLSAHLIF